MTACPALGAHFVTHTAPYGLLQRLCEPLSYVCTSLLSRKNDLAMLLRGQVDSESSRAGLIWCFPPLGTKRQIVLNRVGKCLAEFIDGLPLKRQTSRMLITSPWNRFACSSKAMWARYPLYAIMALLLLL